MQEQDPFVAVEKLQKIIRDRYGKGLRLNQLTDVSGLRSVVQFELQGKDLFIPLRLNEEFLGTAIIPEAEDLAPESHFQISELVKMILEPKLYEVFLKRKELNGIKPAHISEELTRIKRAQTGAEESLEAFTSLMHLCSINKELSMKAALHLHELSNNWAFLNISEIAQNLKSVRDIVQLGRVSIYVPDVETLDFRLQSLLCEYIETNEVPDAVLFITASTLTTPEIENLDTLMIPLKEEMLINQYEMDRGPFEMDRLKTVLELFFFKS